MSKNNSFSKLTKNQIFPKFEQFESMKEYIGQNFKDM
jgi:hypothetical protein